MRTRTSNLLIRSQMLYPIELWVRGAVVVAPTILPVKETKAALAAGW